ncbi:ABC transporter permease [Streptomyces qinzhouensis]|uniref:ABC transporter permease n=1 Tax=Streptomyces qinzhouensis TaxID=2599401 RepID=A0A5B8J907_9ACTN|nr:ABC transporter permease [Streptomyces qinzhouensis]QDY77776.1 ABC transporter permease [Streptomyces qinzhouensis]
MSTRTPPPATGPDTASDAARIHNIGYRNYAGQRLGRAYVRRSLYVQSLRGAFGLGRSAKSKVMPMLLLAVMCLPALIMVAVAVTTKADELPLEYTGYAGALSMVIGLFLAAQAPQTVSRDLRFRTVPLYFSRPIERVDYVLAKYGAMATAMLLLTAFPLIVLYIGALLAKMDFLEQTKQFGQGLVSVAVLSVLYAGIGLVLAATTPRRGFGVAAIIGTLTISFGAVTSVQAIAEANGSAHLVKWFGFFSPFSLIDGVQSAFLGATSAFPGGEGPGAGVGVIYLLVVLALIAGSYAALMRRYAKAGL